MQIKDANKHRRSTALLAVGCLLLQIALAPNIALRNGRANFALVFTGVYALSVGGRSGVVAGFLSGLVFDLLTTGPFGLMSGIATVFAFGLGREARNRFADGFVASLSAFGIGLLAALATYNLAMLVVGESADFFDILFLRTFPSFALTFVCFLPFARHQVRTASQGHGLGTGNASGKHGGHYDVHGI